MDAIDKKILSIIQKNANIPLSELSKRIGSSTTPCWNRIRKMEENKTISGKITIINKEKINLPVTVFLSVSIGNHQQGWLNKFNDIVMKYDQITEVYRSSYFKKTEKFNAEDINSKLNYTRTYTGKDGIDYSDSYSVKSEGVTSFMIKGMWFFDKRQGELKYRMLGIAPLGADVKKEGSAAYDPDEKLELFWVNTVNYHK